MTQFLLEGFAENVPKAGKKCWKALQEKEMLNRQMREALQDLSEKLSKAALAF